MSEHSEKGPWLFPGVQVDVFKQLVLSDHQYKTHIHSQLYKTEKKAANND